MKLLLTFLFASASIFAQYTKNDFKLVKTTATREFDKSIILDYINSKNPQKVVAGLFSASHSLDTSFAEEIIKKDFSKFGETICFALGQIGSSRTSTSFLYDKLLNKDGSKFTHEIFDALGKIVDEELAQEILVTTSKESKLNTDGISIFIYNLSSRKINFDKTLVKDILLSELKNTNGMRKLEALFSIARLGGIKEAEKDLIAILNSKDKLNSAQVKSFAAGCFTRQKYFPNNKKLLSSVLTHKDWRVRTEAAKAVSYLSFSNKSQLNSYFKLIMDDNVNVARQAAISIRNIKLSKILSSYLDGLIEPVFAKSNINSVTKGELFISYCSLNPEKIVASIKKYDKPIQDKYIFETLKNPAVPANDAYSYLAKKINKKEKDILDLIPAFLGLQNKLTDNSKYNTQVLDWLDSKYSSVSSSVADGLDSSFVSKNNSKIKQIIASQIKSHLNDSRYYETIISMHNLSEKAGAGFNKEVVAMMKNSKLFPVQQFINQKSGIVSKSKKDFSNLEALWKNAFSYSKAKVTTGKGTFTIKFYPGYAPISVGNFISLSKKGFYDNVVFHRVVPNFVAQTGDSTGTGFGGPGYDIVSEFSTLPFNTNWVGMASAGRDTEGSQWYVMHNIALHLYGRYSTFGKVVDGTKVIPLINQGDKIVSIQLIK